MSENAYDPPATESAGKTVAKKIKGVGWAKFIGIIMIIFGALYTVTIIFAPIGLPILFSGLAAFGGATNAETYNLNGDNGAAVESMRKFLSYFRIQGIMIVVTIAIYAIALIAFAIAGGSEFLKNLPK